MSMQVLALPRILAKGFVFTECPRWRDAEAKLYFSDMQGNTVHRLDEAGTVEAVCTVPGGAGGIGFLPNGDLVVAAMQQSRVMCRRGDRLDVHADLSKYAPSGINDMVVSNLGRCYVGRQFNPVPPHEDPLIFVDERGAITETADTLAAANGMVLTADGKHLIVAESAASRIAIFELAPDGLPTNKRRFATLPDGFYPDGICGDADGGIWAACTKGPGVVRVIDGGEITHQVPIDNQLFAYACAVGGTDADTLFICTAGPYDPARHTAIGSGHIETVQIPSRRAGIP